MQPDAYQKILQKTFDLKIPFNAQIELTYRCNLSCVHCYATNRTIANELSTTEVENILRQLADLGCLFLSLTGGEIFCRNDAIQIMRSAKSKGFALNLFTNVTLITPELADALQEIEPLCVEISLYAMNPDIHDRITGEPGSHGMTMAAIKLLKERNVNFAIKSPLLKYNVSEYKSLARFAKDMKARFVFDFILVPADNGTHPMPLHGLSEEEVYNFFMANGEPESSTPAKPDSSDTLCGAGSNALCITPCGDVLPCLAIRQSVGNVRDRPLKEIWTRPNLDNFRNLRYCDLQECVDCEYAAYCSRCSGVALAECGNVTGKCECACTVARAIKRAMARLRSNQ